MITQSDIELKAQQYLNYFQQAHQKNSNLLKQLQTKLNLSAKIIQLRWRLFINKKRLKMVIRIQRAWRKHNKCFIKRYQQIKRFKQTFYRGKIAHFIFKKFFSFKSPCNKLLETPIKSFYQKPLNNKSSFTSKITHTFSSHINLTQTYLAEQRYIQKLRVYQKQRFSSEWQKYQQLLKAQLYKQACKKWIRKSNQIWINLQNKQINLEQYIQRHVQKLFKREYEKYKSADTKLQKTSIILAENVEKFKLQYFSRLLTLIKLQ